jgi:NAD(P)H-hydrate epimerase
MSYKPITVAQMRAVDRLMTVEQGIPLLQMMENAGRSLAALTRSLQVGDVTGSRVVVLAGAGNNGGGGLVAARHLANAGAEVRVALVTTPPLPGDIPELQRAALERMGTPGSAAETEVGALSALLARATIILDALIGYGLRDAPRETVAHWIRAANAASARRIALDLPSGLDGDTGMPRDPTIRATATLTLAWPKAGLLAPTALPVVGDLYLADISVPEAVYGAVGVHRGDLFARGPIVHVRQATDGWEPGAVLANE